MKTDRIESILADASLIAPTSIVAGELAVIKITRRHRSLAILSDNQPSYFVKVGTESDRALAIKRETRVYRHLQSLDRPEFAPRWVPMDDTEDLLALELVGESESMHEYLRRERRIARLLARDFGKRLARLHGAPRPHSLDTGPPWVLNLDRPALAVVGEFSDGALGVVEIVQASVTAPMGLRTLRGEWRTDVFIHNDVRLENILVHPAPGKSRKTRTKLVDFELAGSGDPRWDVGAFFASVLSLWVLSVPVVAGVVDTDSLRAAAIPIQRVSNAAGPFWEAYADVSQLPRADSPSFLLEAIRFAGARLAQIAVEVSQQSARVGPEAVLLVQLAENVMSRPVESASQLLGLAFRQ